MFPEKFKLTRRSAVTLLLGAGIGLAPGTTAAQDTSPSSVVRQALDDAWWTGPMLAPSAATLPRGHVLIEPYVYDVAAAGSNGWGSLTYLMYGLADKLTVGLVPTAGFTRVSDGPSSSGVGMGDLTALAQYRLTRFQPGSWIPTTSVVLRETFPTGKHDHLGDRPSEGFGSGAYTTTLALYSQTYFWLSNGRILRMRLNVSQALSSSVDLQDVSVYGTGAGFRGRARPGRAFAVDASWEYSLTRKWVLALDVTYRHQWNTRVTGLAIPDLDRPPVPAIQMNSGSRDSFGFAPAIEYSWKRNWGVLLGVRVVPGSHNSAATITPAVAINFFH